MYKYTLGQSYTTLDDKIEKVSLVGFNVWSQMFSADVYFKDGTVIWDVHYNIDGTYISGLGTYIATLDLILPYEEQATSTTDDSCNHEYVNVGFYTITMACKYCGKEKV